MLRQTNSDDDKGIVYSNRVLIGNWYEESRLEEFKINYFLDQMKKGDLMLAKFRKMSENLNKPTVLTQSPGNIGFGAKICLLAPHAPSTDPPVEGRRGLLLGGRISSNDINYSQELEDGCSVVGLPDLSPRERAAFIITSADYCDRDNEHLKYNQEFLLALSSSVDKEKTAISFFSDRFGLSDFGQYMKEEVLYHARLKSAVILCVYYLGGPGLSDYLAMHSRMYFCEDHFDPLYVRYDPNPIPGLCGMYPLYLSEHPVSNTRWRVLPVQSPNITRFEQEGAPIRVNTDIVINHCATNANLGINIGVWAMGFYGKVCAPKLKTCLDVYGRELPNNIWQIYVPIAD